ncbi:SWI SNF complex component SNF12 homolog, putative [Babesia ovata]|uniref:SWI SNF complex component SNF12 homolog, putative n=1 Tax=Babesia ovata TaxID=189622 RepID=A0A2H6KIF0_9APIC|nr:SWI SNF complex component SNF12 homolog, putative [Babesia ovata]GBE62763.1 SWI SNF complex component SNF12 homolog, putative [Babesia ovata]
MAAGGVAPTEYISQWCHGNYEVMHSCLEQLCRASKSHLPESVEEEATTSSGGFWSRFWRRPNFRETKGGSSPSRRDGINWLSGLINNDSVTVDATRVSKPLTSTSDPPEGDVTNDTLDKMRSGVISGFRKYPFHRPHLVPRRNSSINLDDVRDYVRKKFASVERSLDQIELFSTLANVDQYLCCDMLYEGICYYGNESQCMSEFAIIDGMLHAQSRCQLKCLTLLLSFLNGGKRLSDANVVADAVFPESVSILRDLLSRGLIKNICLLLLTAIKESSRYKSMLSGELSSFVKALYESTIDLVNGLLNFLEAYFLRFHPAKDEIRCLAALLPNVFDLKALFDVSEYGALLRSVFGGSSYAASPWYPYSDALVSKCIGVREFDEMTKNACNVGNRLSLIVLLALHPQHYRLPAVAETGSPLKASLNRDAAFLGRFKSIPTPFIGNNDLSKVLEFVVFGMYLNDTERMVKCLDNGVFAHMSSFWVISTPIEYRDSVVEVVDTILNAFLLSNGALSKGWYEILDHEIRCKRNAEDRARLPYTGASDEALYRHPGRSVMELLTLVAKLGNTGNKRYAFEMWRSCAESYRSLIPNVNCHVYKYNAFENDLYNCCDGSNVDKKTVERLIVPCDGFSWWERNSALLDLVTLAAGDSNTYVETYPRLLSCLLEFALHLCTVDDIEGECGSHLVGKFLSTSASREVRFPFLLERLISQIGSLTEGHYGTLPSLIYEKLLARDDQIETAEAALMIASTIPAHSSQQGMGVGGCLRKMYTFPLISGAAEVKIALATVGLGGRCPFGLIETSIAAFKLVSLCDRIPEGPQPVEHAAFHLDVNIQHNMGDGDHSFLSALFSILSRSRIDGLEMLTSSVLSSLCSSHIKDSDTACAALLRISELLQASRNTAGHGYAPNGYVLSVEELRAFVSCVRKLFVYVPRVQRFRHNGVDWLHSLVQFSLWILDTHCFRNECVHWSLVSDVFEFLSEVAQGPLDACGNTSRASQYLLEQFLLPASSLCISLVRAASEAKLLSAISTMCIIFKRDVLLIVSHRAAMLMSTQRDGTHCSHCGLPYGKVAPQRLRLTDNDMDLDASSASHNWWSNKIRKINSIFSSAGSRDTADEKGCKCLQFDMHSMSLLLAHDAVLEAMNTLRSKNDNVISTAKNCEFVGCFDPNASEEIRIKSVYLLLQVVERMDSVSLVVPGDVLRELHRYYSLLNPCEERSQFVMYRMMESEDLVLYNKVVTMVANFNRMDGSEHWYYCTSQLCDLNRCGLDNLVLLLLKQCALKAAFTKGGSDFGLRLLGSANNIIALIRLASGGGDIWRFSDWRRMDALAAVVTFAKIYPHVLDLVARHWSSLADEASRIDFVHLPHDSYVMQCQRLSNMLQLLILLAERGAVSISLDDITHYVRLYSRFVKCMSEVILSMREELDALLNGIVTGKGGVGVKDFVNLWKLASFPSNLCLAFDLQLCTKLLNPQSCEQLHKDTQRYALRLNSSNMVIASSIGLISCLLNFLSYSTKLGIVGLPEKSRTWLEVACVEFNPEETCELRLALHVALIKQLGSIWIASRADIVGNDSTLSISIVLKLITFVLTHETSTHLRSKIYACVNMFLVNQHRTNGASITELVVAHLLSPSSELSEPSADDRSALLHLLSSDATAIPHHSSVSRYYSVVDDSTTNERVMPSSEDMSPKATDRSNNGIAPMSSGADVNYAVNGVRRIFVGQDYAYLQAPHVDDMSLSDVVEMEENRSSEMLFVAVDNGVRFDYRVEALDLLSLILRALRKFEAGAIEYDLGAVSYGSLGSISTESVSSLLHNRLLDFKRCKQCLLHSPYCPLCLKLLTGTARVLKAASELQQFSAFWYHVQPTSPSICLADLFLSCDLLLGFTNCDKLPTELFNPFISILENLLGMPSVKTRNALIQWMNRHSELLGSLIPLNASTPLTDDKVTLASSLLRIYRVCVLWILAEYRRAKFNSDPLNNFSLILADLQCKFPLAMSMPRSVPALLELLTADLSTCSDCHWQCILLGLQTVFPELGAFEADLDFSTQTPIKALAIEKAVTVATVLTRCGSSLLGFINHLNFLDAKSRRKSLGRFALRVATVECAATLLEYILALVLTHCPPSSSATNLLGASPSEQAKDIMQSGSLQDEHSAAVRASEGGSEQPGMLPRLRKAVDLSRIELFLDKIARLCEDNGARIGESVGPRRKHVLGDQDLLTVYESCRYGHLVPSQDARISPDATMLAALLAHLERSNPRECAILADLESLENRLDELLLSQSHSASLKSIGASPRLRLHISNTFEEQDDYANRHGFVHNTPSSFTIYIRAYEIDADGNFVDGGEEGVLSRYFRQILLCTPDRTVLWDRDGVRDLRTDVRRCCATGPPMEASSSAPGFDEFDNRRDASGGLRRDRVSSHHGGMRPSQPGGHAADKTRDSQAARVGMYGANDGRCLDGDPLYNNPGDYGQIDGDYYAPGFDYWRHPDSKKTSDGVDECGGDPGPYNGYNELQISQVCYSECQVSLYFFPTQLTMMCTISDLLESFLLMVNNGVAVTDSSRQIAFYRIISFLWTYAFERQLVYEVEEGTFFRLDGALSQLLEMPQGSEVAVQDVQRAVMAHVMPPKPIKVTHDIVLSGDSWKSDSFVDVHLDSAIRGPKRLGKTEFEKQVDSLLPELRDLIHVRNLYDSFSRDPAKFVKFALNSSNVAIAKPLSDDVVQADDQLGEPWLPRAIDKYVTLQDRSLFDVLFGAFNNAPKSTSVRDEVSDSSVQEMFYDALSTDPDDKQDVHMAPPSDTISIIGEEDANLRPSTSEPICTEARFDTSNDAGEPVMQDAVSAENGETATVAKAVAAAYAQVEDNRMGGVGSTDIFNISGMQPLGVNDGITAAYTACVPMPATIPIVPKVPGGSDFQIPSFEEAARLASYLGAGNDFSRSVENPMDAPPSLVHPLGNYVSQDGVDTTYMKVNLSEADVMQHPNRLCFDRKLKEAADCMVPGGMKCHPSYSGETRYAANSVVGEGSRSMEGDFEVYGPHGSDQL